MDKNSTLNGHAGWIYSEHKKCWVYNESRYKKQKIRDHPYAEDGNKGYLHAQRLQYVAELTKQKERVETQKASQQNIHDLSLEIFRHIGLLDFQKCLDDIK